jgi:hypothetical protein
LGDLDFLVLLGPFVCFARLARVGWVGLVCFFCSLVHFGRFFLFSLVYLDVLRIMRGWMGRVFWSSLLFCFVFWRLGVLVILERFGRLEATWKDSLDQIGLSYYILLISIVMTFELKSKWCLN